MKVGVVLPLFSGDPEKVVRAARETEDLGFDGAFVFDHFFPPGAAADRPSLEAFTTLAAVAATTRRISVGTLVTRASLRPAGLLAKQASWVDAMSGGRLILGIGTGDAIDRREHEAYGIPLLGRRERRRHLEETVTALGHLFRDEPAPAATLVPAVEGPLRPAPARPGGPPIWVGGLADEVVRLAARSAQGWNGWGLDPDGFGAKARLLAEAAADAGREVEATWAGIVLTASGRDEVDRLLERRRALGMEESWSGTTEELATFLRALRDAGAGWAIFVAAGPKDRRALIAREVLPEL